MQQREGSFNDVAMFPLSCPILSRSMWTGDAVRNSLLFKMFSECLKLTSPIRLEVDNFMIKMSLYPLLKFNKDLKNITLEL